jgi:hypothetical protein
MTAHDNYYGIISEKTSKKDYLIGSELVLERAPKPYGHHIEYNQKEVSNVSCTLHGAIGAYSDLTGYKFTLDERKELWDEAIKLGADPDVGWYINSAVDLIRKYVNETVGYAPVTSYRIALDSFDFGMALRLGYSVIVGYRGNELFSADRNDDGILQDTTFGKGTYGHCLRVAYSVGDEYDLIIDNYTGESAHNTYKISTANWRRLVQNRVFFNDGYIFTLNK